jgi:endonuclease/exonuclease/phosphatase family metal-dependent hydrolase
LIICQGCALYLKTTREPLVRSITGVQKNAENRRRLTIVSYNMLHGWPHFSHLAAREELLRGEILALEPDIILLQEAAVVAGMGLHTSISLARSLDYDVVYQRANGKAAIIGFEEGEAILSRFPVLEWDVHELKPRPSLFERRIVLRAAVRTPAGVLEIYNLHLSHGRERAELREAQTLDAIRYVMESYAYKELPALLAGDFNFPPASRGYRLLEEAGFLDVWVGARPEDPGATSGIDDVLDPSENPRRRIDYLFVLPAGGKSFEIESVRLFLAEPKRVGEASQTGWLWASDHVGLICSLRVEE